MQGKGEKTIPRALSAGLCLLMLIIMMMGVSGCMFQSSEQRVAPKMLQYMEEKYGEEFVLAEGNFMSGNFAGTAVSLWLNPVSHPEWSVTVHYTPGEPFSDNYVGFLKMDEVHDYLKPYFDEVYGAECRLFVNGPNSSALPDSFNKETNLVTYLSSARIGVTLYANKDFSTSDVDAQQLWDIQDFIDYSISVRIYYFSPEAFADEQTQQKTNHNKLPYLYYGDLLLLRSMRNGEYQGVNWHANATTQ